MEKLASVCTARFDEAIAPVEAALIKEDVDLLLRDDRD